MKYHNSLLSLSYEKGVALHLNKFESPLAKDVLNQVSIINQNISLINIVLNAYTINECKLKHFEMGLHDSSILQ